MFAFFRDFSEYIVDMCESYIIINDGKVKSNTTAYWTHWKSQWNFFFDEMFKGYFVMAIKLRNRYIHDYYKREESEKLIEEFCFYKLANLKIFLEESKDKIILKYKDN